jgi:small-conductance mechanosensitive channel
MFLLLPIAQQPATQPAAEAGNASDPEGRRVIIERLMDMWEGFLQLLPNIVLGIIALVLFAVLARIASRFAKGIARKSHLRRSLVDLLGQLTYTTMWIVGLLVAITIIFPSINAGSLLAGLGVTGIVLGFAFKDIVENFIAGVLILWRFPIEIGDWIEVEGIEGKVERINIRMTELRQVDGDLVLMPNAVIFTNPTINWTNMKVRRTTIICGVAYDEDVATSRRIIHDAVKTCSTVNDDPQHAVQIFAQEFASSSINFEVTWWTGSTPLDIRESRDEVVQAVKEALDREGIEIPFPYRTLTFKQPLSLDRGSNGSD